MLGEEEDLRKKNHLKMLVFTDKRNELVLFQTAKCDQKGELLINAGVE